MEPQEEIVDEKELELPECIKKLHKNLFFINNPFLRRETKKIFNEGVQSCIDKIKKEYSFTSDQGFPSFIEKLLRENMIKSVD